MTIDPTRLADLDLYDPEAADAHDRLELLQYLISLGACEEDLLTYRDQLAGLASVLALRGGRALTLAEVVERSGAPEEKLRRLNRAAGFPDPGPEDRVFSEQFGDLLGLITAAEAVFGEETVLQLIRVMGSSMARAADAVVSAFLVNVEPAAREAAGLGIARANADAAALVPGVASALDVLFRQHVVAARRSGLGVDADSGFETQQMSVGFVDLVDSTALAQRLETRELGTALTEFENIAADTVTAHGGRVVKLIGDEVLYTAPTEPTAAAIASQLVEAYRHHRVLPEVRVGLASGEVLLRDGDVFGPVVNLAARAVKAAGPGEIVAPTSYAKAANLPAEPIGPTELKGLDEPVVLSRLIDPAAPDTTRA